MKDEMPIGNQDHYLSHLYNSITIKDFRKDEASISDVLSCMANSQLPNDLNLLNFYREVPIRFGASFVGFGDGVVDVEVHRFQAVCLRAQNFTFLRTNELPYHVIAHVLKVRPDDVVLLSQFAFVNVAAELRQHLRISVIDKVPVDFKGTDKTVSGDILDISYGGIAIVTAEENLPHIQSNVNLVLHLPSKKLEIAGVFMRSEKYYNLTKCVVKFQLDYNQNEKAITGFMFEQQVKVIKELNKLSGRE